MSKFLRVATLVVWDIILMNCAFLLALLIHNEFAISLPEILAFGYLLVVMTVVKLYLYKSFCLYSSLWEYASIEELIKVVGAVVLGNLLSYLYICMMPIDLYLGIIITAFVFELMFIGGIRFGYRILRRVKQSKSLFVQSNKPRVLIIGSGSTASLIAREIKTHPGQYGYLIGFIDHEDQLVGHNISGVKVVGNTYDILSVVKRCKATEIIVAIPTATKEQTKYILDECKRTGVRVKLLPGIMEVIDGHVSMNKIRDVEIEDLLGRDPVNLNIQEIASYINGKTIMITGGGGSIGSELCRQIAKYTPKKLIILDIYENNAYDIQNELIKTFGHTLNLITLIASVRDRKAIFRIIKEECPDVIFHAAAHKHVPLMESSPKEAIKNNVMGTLNVAEAAHECGVDRFVLISTDKAVNPTNVMGATKRLCEMIVQSMSNQSKTKFVAVRFGNVLGSNGSVIPLFKKQISEGGPVTVTHKDIIRYFMTIPEAAQLVVQAGAIAKGGEIFILDMGEPVRIYDLAEDLIRLSGLKPHEDIKIELTGLRPGEKLYEELLMDEEGMISTKYDKIHIGAPFDLNFKLLKSNLEKLERSIPDSTNEIVKERLAALVPTYVVQAEPFENLHEKEKMA